MSSRSPSQKPWASDRSGYNRLNNRVLDMYLLRRSRLGYTVKNQHEFPKEAPRQWFWPSLGTHGDPAKVAIASATELVNGSTTIPANMPSTARIGKPSREPGKAISWSDRRRISTGFAAEIVRHDAGTLPVTLGPGDPNPDDDAEETNQNWRRR